MPNSNIKIKCAGWIANIPCENDPATDDLCRCAYHELMENRSRLVKAMTHLDDVVESLEHLKDNTDKCQRIDIKAFRVKKTEMLKVLIELDSKLEEEIS